MMEVCSFQRVCECGNKANVIQYMYHSEVNKTFYYKTKSEKKHNKNTSTQNREEEKKGLGVVWRTTQRDSRQDSTHTHNRKDWKFRVEAIMPGSK